MITKKQFGDVIFREQRMQMKTETFSIAFIETVIDSYKRCTTINAT